MAQYMFLIYGDEAAMGTEPPSPEQWQQMLAAHQAFAEGVGAQGGQVLGGEALAPTSTATTVRPRPGADALVTDGPFAETKEALGGFYLIEAADLDQALAFAATMPTSGCVEVRPVVPTG
jgi:hypothetical protein